ncbi:MAG: tRNA (N6-isopentenyl adenosine(37)-C2)-methylthiotransferase MiaB, partial [Gammaproteobacteria bacterium]
IEAVNYGYAFSFKYSTRPGTPAAERDQVDEDVKTERLHRLQELITRQQRAVQDASFVGVESITRILFAGRYHPKMNCTGARL